MTDKSEIEQELQNLYGQMETLYGKPVILDEFDQHVSVFDGSKTLVLTTVRHSPAEAEHRL